MLFALADEVGLESRTAYPVAAATAAPPPLADVTRETRNGRLGPEH
jgi:hypothetical protein